MSLLDKASNRISRTWLAMGREISIAPDARVNVRNITLTDGCRLSIGRGSVVEATIDFERPLASLTIGANSYVGASMLKCAQSIEIGNDVEIAWNCSIVDHDWEPLAFEHRHTDKRRWYTAKKDWSHVGVAPVRIGDRAVIGFNAVILKGVTLGEGAVVGVQSVVTHDVPPYTVVAGAPARIVRKLTAPALPGTSLAGAAR